MKKPILSLIFLSLLSGLLGLAAYALHGWGWLMWLAWVPLLVGLDVIPKKWSGGFPALLIALGVSVGGYLVLLSIKSWMLYFAVVFPVILALLFSLFWWVTRKALFGVKLVLVASGITMIDFLLALTPITAVISPAITQAGFPLLLSPASLFGFPFVTFLIMGVNGLIALMLVQWLERKPLPLRPVLISAGILLCAFLLPLTFSVEKGGTVQVGALDAGMIDGGVHNPDPLLGAERQALADLTGSYASLTQEAALSGADVILWSEKFLPVDPLVGGGLEGRIEQFIDEISSTVVVTYESEARQNIAVPVFPGSGFAQAYQKINIAGVVGEDLVAGSERPIYELNGHRFGILICFDMHFEENTRALANSGAEFILVSSNSGSQTNSIGWVARTAAIRAVENHLPFVVSSDIGAYFVSPLGDIHTASRGTTPSVLIETIEPTRGITFYNTYGGHYVRWLVIPLFLGVLVAALVRTRKFKMEKNTVPQSEPTLPV
jgi:apolipoprotein N-acyltransferase